MDTIHIPTELGFKQTGGIDFLALSFKTGNWRLALGLQRGDYLGADFNADCHVSSDYEFDFIDTLTSSDFGGIPEGETIPVQVNLSGMGEVSLHGKGSGSYRSGSFIIAVARRLLGLDIGLGWQITPFTIDGRFDALFKGRLLSASGVSVVTLNEWTSDAKFNLVIDADSIICAYGNTEMKFYLSTIYWGIKKEWRYLSLGICGEFSPPVLVSGSWKFVSSLPAELPKIRFEDDRLIIDTLNKHISGSAKMVIYGFEKEDKTRSGDVKKLFLSSNGITSGMSLRIWRFEFGSFGGLNFSADGTYLKMKGGINLSFLTFIPIRFGTILHFQYLRIGDIPITALPVISLGGGTDFKIKKFNFFLNFSGNTTHGAASLIIPGIIGGERTRSSLFSAGFGLKYNY
ncbi:MAG: hypothetical protein N3A65_04485 [candidate division WOR-3 bacterium]|nr:hypothetical protein [candidate division WOR-3 bacterium]